MVVETVHAICVRTIQHHDRIRHALGIGGHSSSNGDGFAAYDSGAVASGAVAQGHAAVTATGPSASFSLPQMVAFRTLVDAATAAVPASASATAASQPAALPKDIPALYELRLIQAADLLLSPPASSDGAFKAMRLEDAFKSR